MRKDGRKLDHQTLEAIRMMAVERVREGEAPSAVIQSYGFCRTTIYKWLSKIDRAKNDPSVLVSRPATGRPRRLTTRQEQQIFKWINGKDPRQYGFDFGLWTRRIVADLIARKFGHAYSLASVGELLARLDLTPQKPLQRAYQRDPEAVDRWKRELFPAISRRARDEGAEIYFWDESGFRADSVHGKTWGAKGKTPVIERPGQRQSISAASAVNATGGFWYCTYEGGLTAELFISLLRKMMRNRETPIHLVLDGLPAHKTGLVKQYVESMNGRLTLHFLPGYAPDLNPDELVWSHMKRTGVARAPLRKGEKLADKVRSQLAKIKKSPGMVRAFFNTPSVAYIADC